MRELRFRGVLFHPSGHITGMLWRWESSWSLSLRYTIPSHMMSFVLMRQAFDISTHLHDRSIYLSPSFTSNFCSNQPLCISVLLSAPSTWVNLFPLLQLLNQCCLWPQQFHLPYFLISTKPSFPSLPFYAPPTPLPDLHSFDLSSIHLISPTSWAAFWQFLVFSSWWSYFNLAFSHPRFPDFLPHKPWFTALFPPLTLYNTIGYR